MGQDNLNNLHLWKHWKEILLYAHLLILPRKSKKKYNYELKNWIIEHTITNKKYLYQRPFGLIFFSSIPMITISSTQIRKNFFSGKSLHNLVPTEVEKYIALKKLY